MRQQQQVGGEAGEEEWASRESRQQQGCLRQQQQGWRQQQGGVYEAAAAGVRTRQQQQGRGGSRHPRSRFLDLRQCFLRRMKPFTLFELVGFVVFYSSPEVRATIEHVFDLGCKGNEATVAPVASNTMLTTHDTRAAGIVSPCCQDTNSWIYNL